MYSVTLRQLEVFRGVVNIGSFSGAARQLRISQPSVSMHIRALEDRLREPVFDRTRGKTPVLTDVGHRIYDHVEDVLEQPGGTLANVDTLKAVKPSDLHKPVLVPGEPEQITRTDRSQNGIPVNQNLRKLIQEVAIRADVEYLLANNSI